MNAHNTVAVIGGGAAGMMAACEAAEAGAEVLLFEKNSFLGKKLRITGKGRCNVTNNCTNQEFLQNVRRNSKFLYSAVYRFGCADAMEFFESSGVPLKTERGRRVFPVSDKAADIARALERRLSAAGCTVVHGKVDGILYNNGAVCGVACGGTEYHCGAAVVATGGLSYPGTGSTGDGYALARKAGLRVTELSPSLVPVVTREDTSPMMGLSLKNVVLTLYRGEKKIYSEMGEMLFTHFGVSGPLVLSASAHMQGTDLCELRLEIDLKPALSREALDARVIRDLDKYAAKDFVNALWDLLPRKLVPEAVRRSGIPEHIKAGSVTREMRRALVDTLKSFRLTPTALRPIAEAIVTCGGVDVSELNPGSMMSKKVPGLFFAGEVIDADAYTGGYNLQIAWSTGALAGAKAAEYIYSI